MSARRAAYLAVRAAAIGLLVTVTAAGAQDARDTPSPSTSPDERELSAEALIARGEVQADLDQIDAAEASFV